MLQRPKTYEEAKIIINNSVGSDLRKHNRKLNIIRAALINAIGIGALVALGVKNQSMTVPLAGLPLFGVISLSSFIPFFVEKKVDKAIKNGTYYNGMTEEQVIYTAKKYVDDYNAYEEKVARKGR